MRSLAKEGGTPGAGLNSWGSLVAGGSGEDNDSYPKAFVNILVFDKNYNLLEIAYDGINGGHQEGISPDVDHDYMKAVYLAREECYVYLYISNENATLVDVYFDDVIMTHKRSRLIQGSEYYPYGMQTANSWTREGFAENNLQSNGGSELNSVTQLYDLDYRNYDPILGRFQQVDPMSSKFGSMSPYGFGLFNPTNHVDPSGADATNPAWTIEIDWNAIPDDGGLTIRNTGRTGDDMSWTGTRWMKDFGGLFAAGLWIDPGNGRLVQVIDGVVYDQYGEKYTQGWGVKSKNESVKYTGALGKVMRALGKIDESDFGHLVLESLENSPFKVVIKPTQIIKNHFEAGYHNSEVNNAGLNAILNYNKIYVAGQSISDWGSGGYIYWNSSLPLDNVRGTTSLERDAIGLGHELFHAYDAEFANLDRWDLNGNIAGGLERSEYRATYFENYLRNEFKAPYREAYNNFDVLKNGVPIYVPPPIWNAPYEPPSLPPKH